MYAYRRAAISSWTSLLCKRRNLRREIVFLLTIPYNEMKADRPHKMKCFVP